jgi:hypothetical protein
MSKKILVRKAFERTRSTAPDFRDPNKPILTQQQFKKECDLNEIVAKARRGIAPTFNPRAQPVYGDFTNVPDLCEAMNRVISAREAFMTLPSGLRAELDNDFTRIDSLTEDQIKRYKLGRDLSASTPQPADPGFSGGQPEASKAKPEGAKAASEAK